MITQAEADRIRAEAQAQGQDVCTCAAIADPQLGLIDRLAEWLIPGLNPVCEVENEAEAG